MTQGFSLIELLIALAIASILSSIAYTGYCNNITHTHRSDGQTALLDLAIRMENYYSKNNTYQTATIGTGRTTDILKNPLSPEGFYKLSLSEATDSAYTLKATPINAQANADISCQSLTFNNLGAKGISPGPAGTPTGSAAACW